ncbi:MAG: hypothetical protein WCP21_17810, partial [Armatimonadota bacterium]
MTETTRLKLGAYFLFAILLLTLPVTLLVTHVDTVRHAKQWKATPTGVQLANANYRPQAVQWAKKTYGLSTAGAEKYVRDTEKRTKTTLDLGENVPYGAQLDYYSVDGTKTPQTAKYDGSARVAAAASPETAKYLSYVKALPAEKKSPEFLNTLSTSLKKGYALIPTAFGQAASATKRGGAPLPRGAKAATTNIRIAVIFTKLPGLRDVSPRSDGDTVANDTANLFINYADGASNP